jgi:pilus assembly protein Flp/PilA
MKTLNAKGQGMTEYILIVALIAIFVIGGIKLFGSKTKQGFNDAASAVGENVQQGMTGASSAETQYSGK